MREISPSQSLWPHLVPTWDCREGGEGPGAEVEVAVDGAGRGPVRGADDGVEVLHSRGDDVPHGEGLETDWRVNAQSVEQFACYIY